jgi:MULE transposase domain
MAVYKGPIKYIVRFSPIRYPITGGFGKDAGGQHLITDLCQIARSHGHCALTSNGSAGRGCKNQRVLICSHARKYHPKAVPCKMEDMEMDTTTYRVTTYIGDKKNARGSKSSGKALKRRTSTLRDSGCACTAKLVIRLDQLSFYLVCGLGDNKHTGHPPMESNEITNRKRYLDVATLENVTAMAAANILPAQAVSLTRIQTGELFTRGQMAYVQGFSRMARNLMDAEHCLPDASPSENMLHYLRKTGASFVCLYQNGKAKEKEFRRGNRKVAAPTESFDRSSMGRDTLMSLSLMEGSSAVHTLIPLEVTECADFKDYAEKSRNAVGARDDQDMLIACCWVLPNGRRLFHAFPEVVGVDGTHETNNESRPLLTLSVKDSDGNVIVVVRCFAPNERSWLFRWFFQEALPLLLGPEALKMVNLIMTDGDSQEMAQVDYAIDTFFVNAVRTRCGWHLVHQGWRRECRGLGFRKGKKAAAKRQVRIIQNWLYSWMRRGVNSKAHYEM